jgi:glyceraldehyde 3-phosphate dehydrogenase
VSGHNFRVAGGGGPAACQVNRLLARAAVGAGDGSFRYSDDAQVSVDFRGSAAGATLDARWTEVARHPDRPGLLRLVAWYDNESGYAHQVLRVVRAARGQAQAAPVPPLRRFAETEA